MNTTKRILSGLLLSAVILSSAYWLVNSSDAPVASDTSSEIPGPEVRSEALSVNDRGVEVERRHVETAGADLAVESGPVFQHRVPFQPDPVLSQPDVIRVGDRVPLPAPIGSEIYGVVDSISRTAGERTVLRGQIDEAPFGHFVISIAPDGRQLASVHVDQENSEYFVRYDPDSDSHLLRVLDLASLPDEAPCETCSRQAAGDVMAFDSGQSGSDSESLAVASDTATSSMTTIDIMVVYTPAAAEWAALNDDGIDALILDSTARAQLAMDNSEGRVEFRLVHQAPVDYQESNDGFLDLMRLTETYGPYREYLHEVHALRNQYGADLVTMLVEGVDYGGIGWLLRSMNGDPGGGFSISRARQAATAYTFAHEIGHNLGLAHDSANASSAGLFDYSFGWRWKGSNGANYSSVMAYPATTRVPHFSNPNISFMGAPTGHATLADNARTIRESRHVVAAYRSPREAKDLDLNAAVTTLQAGESTVLTAEIVDQAGGLITDGDDSALTVVFRQVSGDGIVHELGDAQATDGVASIVIHGGTTSGNVVLEASAESASGTTLTSQLAIEVANLSVSAGTVAEVDTLYFEDQNGEIVIAEDGILIVETLELSDKGRLEIRGEGLLRVTTLVLAEESLLNSAGTVEVGRTLIVESGGRLEIAGALVLTTGTSGVIESGAELTVGALDLQTGAELVVGHGSLTFGDSGSVSRLDGVLEVFHSLGSVIIGGDVTVTGVMRALASDIHLAEGVLFSVETGGEVTVDGCLMDSPGVGFTLTADAGAILTMVRSVFENGDIVIRSGDVFIRDNLFRGAAVEVEAGGDGAAVYHNVVDSPENFLTLIGGPRVTVEVDGWGNVEDRGQTRNELVFELATTGLGAGRSLDGEGNLYIQPGDTFEAYFGHAVLAHAVDRAEFMAGYPTGFIADASLAPRANWVEVEGGIHTDGDLGRVNGAFTHTSGGGSIGDAEIARLRLTAQDREGQTFLFFMDRQSVQVDDGPVDAAFRLESTRELLTPFTVNSGYVTIDGTAPRIAEEGAILQYQGGVKDMTRDGATVEQGILRVEFEAFDALAGIDDSGVEVTLVGLGGIAGELIQGQLADSSLTVWIDGDAYTRYVFEVAVTPATVNGDYLVHATAADRSGNQSAIDLGQVRVNKNEIDVDLSLQGYSAGTDESPLPVDVTFAFTDAFGVVLEERLVPVLMGTENVDRFTFTQVPDGTAYLSANAPKHLRRRLPAALDAHGQGAVRYMDGNRLLAGDLNGDNSVRSSDLNIFSSYWLQNVADNAAAEIADLTGDGRIRSTDLAIFQSNWLVSGDPK